MDVIRWQIAVLVTVAVAYRFHRSFGTLAAVAWTIWTLAKIRYSLLLMVIQIGFAWGTVFVSYRAEVAIRKRDAEIARLREALSFHPEETQRRIEALPRTALRFISGEAHARTLIEAVESAQRELFILSGWVSAKVVDEPLLRAMWDAINRGVTIYIGYGFQNFEGKHEESKAAQKAIEDLGKLEKVARRKSLGGGVVLRKFANHEKILVIDDTRVICGSHNWLSNTRFENAERSVAIQDPEVVHAEGERVRALISPGDEGRAKLGSA